MMRTPKEDLLIDGLDDWAYAGWVANSFPASESESIETLRHQCVGLISEVLVEGLMVPGDVVEGAHHPWRMSTGEAIENITREWITEWPQEIPGIGAIVWLSNTAAGDAVARAALTREASGSAREDVLSE